MRNLLVAFNVIRCSPHIMLFFFHRNSVTISADVQRWQKILAKHYAPWLGFVYLLSFHPEYRNLFYYRVGFPKHFLKILLPEMSTLFLNTPQIGEGLFIQHGFATIINAHSIGKNCWINQQVTIGFTNATDRPTLQDNVTVYAGAKVLGDVTIADNAIVGANAVVVKNVPANSTAVGVPARIINIRKLQNEPY